MAARKGREDVRERPSDDARERILAVAAREFADKGYDGATTAAIAKAAGVTQPLVHYYFASKELLWKAAVDLFCQRLQWLEESSLEDLRDLDPLSQLKVLARRFVNFVWRYPELARMLTQEGARGGPRFQYIADSLLKPMLSVVESALDKAQRDGWLKPLPVRHLLFLWLGAASQLFATPALAQEMGLDPQCPSTPRQYADAYVEMVFHGLTRPVRAEAAQVPEGPKDPSPSPKRPS